METNQPQPKPYDQARKEAFVDHVANSGGRSEYMQVDFDAGFSAGYNAALHDRERELRERAAIAAMKSLILMNLGIADATYKAVLFANTLVNQLNTPQS